MNVFLETARRDMHRGAEAGVLLLYARHWRTMMRTAALCYRMQERVGNLDLAALFMEEAMRCREQFNLARQAAMAVGGVEAGGPASRRPPRLSTAERLAAALQPLACERCAKDWRN